MQEIQGRERDFVLAPNESVFIQDQTKGQISVYVGPHKSTLASTDCPIIYDRSHRKFIQTELQRAVQQFSTADEGFYIVLENPAEDEKRAHPELGTVNSLTKLKSGRKINIPGPQTFPLWPGQVAQVVEGHRLRTNQYLMVRVYNDEEARNNQASAIIRRADSATIPKLDGSGASEDPEEPSASETVTELTMGKLFVIKGDEVSFYIPPTGIEVVPDDKGRYVREAVTLERLEYCVLLSEDGNKRYVKGPVVVFPEPTENFIPAANGNRKYKAVELNDDMGLYIKVTADYTENEKIFKAGDELFITGHEQRLYYPRAEHGIIKYGDREIHYGIAIPDGEARYVLDKRSGKVELVRGPQIFLPDPRKQVIVRRVLTNDEVNLWFPGNKQAQEYNSHLRELLKQSSDIVAKADFCSTLDLAERRATRSVLSEDIVVAFAGDEFDRGAKYTPPRTITLDTKFEGAVAISVWNGYAVLVVNKEGNQRIEVGPKTILLGYDETLQVLQLSTGKPKTTDKLERTVYLRVRFNQVSDIVNVVTRDMVPAQIKLSYRVNFEDEPTKWFLVENYVKFMTDHARSLLRNAAKRHTIEDFNANYIDIVRDTILGTSEEGKRKGRLFEENGVLIYDIEISHLLIGDEVIGKMLVDMQQSVVRQTLKMASREHELETTEREEIINQGIAVLKDATAKHKNQFDKDSLIRRQDVLAEELKALEATEKLEDATNDAVLARDKKASDQKLEVKTKEQQLQLDMLTAQVEAFAKKFSAMTPDFVAAVQTFGDRNLAEKLAEAIAPLALAESQGLQHIWERTFRGTPAEQLLNKAFKD